MKDADVFEFVCEQLEARTSFDRLESRGTVRLALKQAGLEARSVNREQMSVVVNKLLVAELESRGVADGAAVCRALDRELATLQVDDAVDTPEAVFERLGS